MAGWPFVTTDGDMRLGGELLLINAAIGGMLAVAVGLMINRLGRQRWRINLRQALLVLTLCAIPLAYFSAPGQAVGVYRPPATLHLTEIIFLGIGLVCACCTGCGLPGLLREYRRRIRMMNQEG